jgi:hypothetical protein
MRREPAPPGWIPLRSILVQWRSIQSPRKLLLRSVEAVERRRERADALFAPVGLLSVAQLLFHLEFEVVGGLAELVHELADLLADLRQATRPEDHKREHHEDQRVGHAERVKQDWRRRSHEES